MFCTVVSILSKTPGIQVTCSMCHIIACITQKQSHVCDSLLSHVNTNKENTCCAPLPWGRAASSSLPSSGLDSGRQTLHPPPPAHYKQLSAPYRQAPHTAFPTPGGGEKNQVGLNFTHTSRGLTEKYGMYHYYTHYMSNIK